MSDSTHACAGSVAPAQIATCHRPDREHAVLRDEGIRCRDGEWVVARPADVLDALMSSALTVAPPAGEAARPDEDAREMQSRMARFSDGPQHRHRRELVEQLLPEATGLRQEAAQRTSAALAERVAAFDVMPLAKTLPVEVLAASVGVPAGRLAETAAVVGRLCDALTPALGARSVKPEDGHIAARELTTILSGIQRWDLEQLAAAAGLLFQARDATAALIGTAVFEDHEGAVQPPETLIDRVLRRDAPVQCTRRSALEDVALGGVTISRGDPVWVVLAAAEQGPPSRPATFGGGPHECPGAAHATALAAGVVSALRADGWQPVPGQPLDHEPRPNLRAPSRVLVQRP